MCECCVAAESTYSERKQETEVHHLNCEWFMKPVGMRCSCGLFEKRAALEGDYGKDGRRLHS